ncbi:MAG: Fe-S cluster assembly ATPase SufC [Porphyromonas sp.]|nr:Fe-S cluster assembly ATPase SufC [Porphyromonas sp.]
MINIKDLHARIGEKEILRGLSLHVPTGEVHAIMGPNGSGKSTFANVLTGNPRYEVTSGSVTYQGQDLLALQPEERAQAGIFMSFQYPVEIPGVSMTNFLRTAINSIRANQGLQPMSAAEFLKLIREKQKLVELSSDLARRPVNVGFSGGEKKRNEIFQMAVLEPKLAILDETDSGLDIDALKVVAHGVNSLRSPERSTLVITHYQRLLDIIQPDVVHVLLDGRIVKTGGPELVLKLEKEGYDWLRGEEQSGV